MWILKAAWAAVVAEWPVIEAAPGNFAGGVLVIGAIVGLASWFIFSKTQSKNQKSEISLLETQTKVHEQTIKNLEGMMKGLEAAAKEKGADEKTLVVKKLSMAPETLVEMAHTLAEGKSVIYFANPESAADVLNTSNATTLTSAALAVPQKREGNVITLSASDALFFISPITDKPTEKKS